MCVRVAVLLNLVHGFKLHQFSVQIAKSTSNCISLHCLSFPLGS